MKLMIKKSTALSENTGSIFDTLKVADKIKNTYSANIIDELIKTVINTAKLEAHPIGSYYWSDDATDPSELFGGTWERIKDTFLYALGDEGNAGDIGGASSVTLTKANLPNYTLYNTTHNHTQNPHHHLFSSGGNAISVYTDSGVLGGNGFETSSPNTAWAGANINLTGIAQSTATNQAATIKVDSGGSDTPFDIIPTHIKAYCWKRTA